MRTTASAAGRFAATGRFTAALVSVLLFPTALLLAALLIVTLVPVELPATLIGTTPAAQTSDTPRRLKVRVLDSFPHDRDSFTQGLELHNGLLYEGTGRYGQSRLRTLVPTTGVVRRQVTLPESTFGEGITVVGPRIWQLTYREGVAFLRDRRTLAEIRRVKYQGEGWGLCHDQTRHRLIMSDGTPALTFRDPRTFRPLGSVTTTRNGTPLYDVNELECVDGMVWANIWFTDQIVRIDPATGVVDTVVDATGLLSTEEQLGADALNGIAAVSGTDTFLITGKLWPRMFLVRFVSAD